MFKSSACGVIAVRSREEMRLMKKNETVPSSPAVPVDRFFDPGTGVHLR
jgi:hypothetical protein